MLASEPNSEKIKMDKTIEWLKNEAYLPGYMTLATANNSNNIAYFDFNLVEPPVTKVLDYLTPRGGHICISQASYWLTEQLVKLGKMGVLDVKGLRNMALEGRLKIVELNQKFRKEIKVDKKIQGKFILTNLRLGKMPLIEMDFELSERAVRGKLIGVLAPKPVPQANADITRNLR